MKDPTEQVIEIANRYFDKVVDAPLRELGGILSDTVGYWRFKNQINTILKTKEFLEKKGINPRKALPDTVVPLLESAGDTSDEFLQDMFAGLLAAHLSPDDESTVHPSFAKVISQLAPLDAFLLKDLYRHLKFAGIDYRTKALGLEQASKNNVVSKDTMILTFQNIWRLGICDHGASVEHLNRTEQLVFTPYGWALMGKCAME